MQSCTPTSGKDQGKEHSEASIRNESRQNHRWRAWVSGDKAQDHGDQRNDRFRRREPRDESGE